MKQYLLLRDNQESGPWSREELSVMGLKNLDLIWIEQVSTQWTYAPEVEDLKNLVQEDAPAHPAHRSGIFVSLPGDRIARPATRPAVAAEPELETRLCQPLEALKERKNEFHKNQEVFQKRMSTLPNVLNVAAVFLGLMLGAVLIKKMVDGNDAPLSAENTVAAQVIEEPPVSVPAQEFQRPLVTEEPEAAPATDFEVKPAAPSVKPKDIKRQVKVTASGYKVGVFGGISDLKLKVYNGSPHYVDRIVVSVDYLKPNGDVVDSRKQVIQAVKPYGSRTLELPENRRGVKVRYHVVSIYSQDYSAALRQI